MTKTERFAIIERMLLSRRCVHFSEMQQRLEISRATLYRDLRDLRDRMQLPIVSDRAMGTYAIDRGTQRHELPGLWFSSTEIHALLSTLQLLDSIDGSGILAEQVAPLRQRLCNLLESRADAAGDIARRVRIVGSTQRTCDPRHFQVVATALMQRRRLQISYAARSDGLLSEREISPQRLVHYRDNWYLDAWCHLRGGLRSFAVDAMRVAKIVDVTACEIEADQLDAALNAGYGIFNGPASYQAELMFSAERARWVASERWHPQQHGEFLPDGRYLLRVPYSQDPELIMDILKYGPDCEVVGPEGLRQKVEQLLLAAARRYGDG